MYINIYICIYRNIYIYVYIYVYNRYIYTNNIPGEIP